MCVGCRNLGRNVYQLEVVTFDLDLAYFICPTRAVRISLDMVWWIMLHNKFTLGLFYQFYADNVALHESVLSF
jgi:hypothetical protein